MLLFYIFTHLTYKLYYNVTTYVLHNYIHFVLFSVILVLFLYKYMILHYI